LEQSLRARINAGQDFPSSQQRKREAKLRANKFPAHQQPTNYPQQEGGSSLDGSGVRMASKEVRHIPKVPSYIYMHFYIIITINMITPRVLRIYRPVTARSISACPLFH
jgi:hypothetical protein